MLSLSNGQVMQIVQVIKDRWMLQGSIEAEVS